MPMHPRHAEILRNLGYTLPQSTIDAFQASQEKAARENAWFAKHFPVVISPEVRKDTIYAVNFQGIIDDMQRGKSYAEAVKTNSAAITGLL